MATEPQAASYKPDTAILSIADGIGEAVKPAVFPSHVLRFRNDNAATQIGLSDLSNAEWIRHFGRFEPLKNNLPDPLALRYHGHQFRVYNPEIGDGRGFLFAQMRDSHGRLMDLGTKGSGTTPYSRQGDGRLTLKGAVRELLATEMLQTLGVPTSQTFSIIETGEPLWRDDEPSPARSAVLVRLSHGHIRFGSFQRLAFEGQYEMLEVLVRYCLRHYYHDQQEDDAQSAALRLLDHICCAMAGLAASYMTAGFVHGVLNTDNMNISAESFDYGPWRFTPKWQPGFTAAYFDHQGLYRFSRQAEAIHWNLSQLAIALRPLAEAQPLIDVLEQFAPRYWQAFAKQFLWRLGLQPCGKETDHKLLERSESLMMEEDITIDRFFFAFMGQPKISPQQAARETGIEQTSKHLIDICDILQSYTPSRDRTCDYWSFKNPQSMHIEEVEAIWSHIEDNDNWQPLLDKLTAIRDVRNTMGQSPAQMKQATVHS